MPDWQPRLDVFVGRDAELAHMAEVVRRAQSGQPWLVAVEGEPGMGKTTLTRRCLAGAAGVRVLSGRADQAETDLRFGIADQLLRSAARVRAATVPASVTDAPASSFAMGARLLHVVGELQATGTVAIVIDDLQWADSPSVEALTFMLRRLSVDAVTAFVIYRGTSGHLDEAAQRLLVSVENRTRISLGGLRPDEVARLAAALTAGPLDERATRRLHQSTGGHPLYLRALLSEGSGFDPRAGERLAPPRSLADVIGGHLRALPPDTRTLLEMLSVLNARVPLAQLGQAAQVGSAGVAAEQAVAAGLADWSPDQPSSPVVIRHLLVRDAIYAGIPAVRRRVLHARAAMVVSGPTAWQHRVAALDQPDEGLAAELERLAEDDMASGHPALAATHLQWASDISPARPDRERRLATAALHLTTAEESRGMALREAVRALGPSPLRSCALGAMALYSGQLAEAQRWFSEALTQAQAVPDTQPLAGMIASRLAATYMLLGDGERGISMGKWALSTDCLDSTTASRTRTMIAIGASQTAGPGEALAELAHLDDDPARVDPVDVDGLAFRGVFRLLTGDLDQAVTDLTASAAMVREGATLTLGLRTYSYQALAQYLAGAWDDALLTCEQAFSAAAIHSRRYELPLLNLAACCVPAGRGMTSEAEQQQQGHLEQALATYQQGEEAAGDHSPVYTARLLLAHGRLLRRAGNRKDAVERLRRARGLFATLRATPFTDRTEQELAACRLPASPATKQSVLALTGRETEVAYLVGKGMSNLEIAGELFISRKAVEFHLSNIYAKYGLRGRQQLRRVVEQWREPTAI